MLGYRVVGYRAMFIVGASSWHAYAIVGWLGVRHSGEGGGQQKSEVV